MTLIAVGLVSEARRTSPPVVVVAWLRIGGQHLLQLRDFHDHIDDPGLWGMFGGHLGFGEDPAVGLRRELLEELGWTPNHLEPLGEFALEDRQIIGFLADVNVPIAQLVLGEGHDLGAFSGSEIRQGHLFSSKCNKTFPLTPITRHAVRLWSRDLAVLR